MKQFLIGLVSAVLLSKATRRKTVDLTYYKALKNSFAASQGALRDATTKLDHAQQQLERKVRWIEASEVTEKQRRAAQSSELFKVGDMVLVWVNQGDILALGKKHT